MLLSVVTAGHSQLSTFNLFEYSQPDFYRKISYITPNVFLRSYTSEPVTSIYAVKNNNGLNLSYDLTIDRFSSKKQSTTSLGTLNSFQYVGRFGSKSKSIFHSQYLSTDHKFFMSNRDYFMGIEFDYYGGASYETENQKEINGFDPVFKGFIVNLSNDVVFKIGKGRIENVNVAWHAIRILESICDHSSLEQSAISHAQVEGLANKMAEIQNIRLTDLRLEFSKEIESLFNYLKSSNLIEQENYTLFSKVLDAYQFESFANRRKGSDFYIGLGLEYDYQVRHLNYIDKPLNPDEYEYEYSNKHTGPFLVLGYNYHKPLNHNWQLDFENTVTIQKDKFYSFYENTESPSPTREDEFEEQSGYATNRITLQYLKSRRTNILFGYTSFLDHRKYLDSEMEVEMNTWLQHSNNFNIDFQYYFSPRHTLNIDLTFYHIKEYKNESRLNKGTSLNIRTVYRFH